MPTRKKPSSAPMKADAQPIVEVAVAIVVDKLSDLINAQPRPEQSAPAINAKQPAPSVLISLRRAEQVLGGLWELPGGKVEPNETPAQAVLRELQEEVGIHAKTIHALPPVEHTYDHAHIRLHPYICTHLAGTPSPIEVDAVRWVPIDRLNDYPFPKATQPIIQAFLNWLDNQPQPASP